MTFGAEGAAAGILLLLLLVGCGTCLLLALVLGVVEVAVRLGTGRWRHGLTVAVAVLAVLGVGPVAGLAAWGALTGPPDTLVLDLREPVRGDDLPEEEFPGFRGSYDVDSDHLRLTLPDGRVVAVTGDGVVVLTDDRDRVVSVSTRTIATTSAEAARTVRTWAAEAGVATTGLGDRDRRDDWRSSRTGRGYRVEVGVQPTSGDQDDVREAIPRLRVDLVGVS